MASVAMSETGGEPAAPQTTFHVSPPPSPRPRTWTRELGISLGLALLINLLVLLPLLFGGPRQSSSGEGPPAIEVEIIQEPQPEPEPEPQQQQESRAPFNFGADEAPEEPGDTTRPERAMPRPREDTPQNAMPRERSETPPLPEWAQTIERSYSAASPDSGKVMGRGDAYGRMLRQRLNANLVLPSNLDLARIVPPHANVSFDRSGRLVGLVLVRSSGSSALDRAMLDAIRRSFPVPPIPAHVPDNVVTLPLSLDFQ
ncbi:MAG: TonB C-terminal domain-containing protein [Alphaproteobacteria bacterium]|nr:TonB C-terminal domain-containing protein [Alphaproteobacteria bacterium]MDX5417367.1 TonB C-terminal domain-containing protein [Alphaproteobacteria bacterium]MDX5494836.1 TonB C-terminal domain-containing protein [Alphaproteobacteria bacterium]